MIILRCVIFYIFTLYSILY